MPPPGEASDSGELAFDRLLISESFSPENCRDYPLTTCISWLTLRTAVASTWQHEFRMNREDLYGALKHLRSNLNGLYQKMNRLCEGPRSYLAACPENIPPETRAYYQEFLTAYDRISDALEEYIAYANHYKISLERGEIPQTKSQGARGPTEIKNDLFENLGFLTHALQSLAGSLQDLQLEAPEAHQDPPGEPEPRTA